jgi:hypothetical protein
VAECRVSRPFHRERQAIRNSTGWWAARWPATGNRLDGFLGAARNGAAPEGIEPLKIDIFTSGISTPTALWTDGGTSGATVRMVSSSSGGAE